MRERATIIERPKRPAYEGMGLGLFIAKTLLERTSAELRFFNADNSPAAMGDRTERIGAVVEVTWSTKSLIVDDANDLGPLGHNQQIVP
jgi:two-component system sensor histidine kinase RegB